LLAGRISEVAVVHAIADAGAHHHAFLITRQARVAASLGLSSGRLASGRRLGQDNPRGYPGIPGLGRRREGNGKAENQEKSEHDFHRASLERRFMFFCILKNIIFVS
jgi:hypothetical protein